MFIAGEIGQVLKARVTDSNKAVQSLALDIVSRIATGMGKPFEKQTRFFALPVCTVLADQKAPVRNAALQTLTAIATACESVESMVHGLNTALESSNPIQRATLLNWIVDWFKEHEPPATLDLSSWAGPVVACLDDRSGDVRKGAQALLPFLIACAGFECVMQQTNSLKPASRNTAIPLIQAARQAAPARAAPVAAPPAPAAKPAASKPSAISVAPSAVSPPPQSPTTSAPAPKAEVPSKLMGVRRKLPLGTIPRPESRTETTDDAPPTRLAAKPGLGGLRRPAPAPKVAPPPPTSGLPFSSTSLEVKKARLSKDAQKWINEGGATRKDLAELLQHQMEPHASKELVGLLFSHDHNAVNDHVHGLSILCDFFHSAAVGDDKYGLSPDDLKAIGVANFDLALKYVSIKSHEPQSNLIAKCLDTVDAVIAFLRGVNCQLNDAEAMCFIPTIVYKVFTVRYFATLSSLNILISLATPESLCVRACSKSSKRCPRYTPIAEFSNYCSTTG